MRARPAWRPGAALGPVTAFTVLTAIMTWPLVRDLGGTVISNGVTADADVGRWDLWWVKTALLERHANPFYTDLLYYPYRGAAHPLPLYYHTLQPLNGLLALPVLLLTGPTVGPTLGFNLLMFAHFVLTGCAMLWLVRYLTGSSAGGLVAGILFTFGAFHQYHLHEAQLELVPLEWLPLYILFLHRLLYRVPGRARLRDGALAVVFLLAAAFTSWYLTLYLLLAGGVLALIRLGERPREWRRTVGGLGAVLLAWLVLVSPFLLATIRAGNDPTFELVSGLDYEVRFSLSPADLVTAAKDARLSPAVWNLGPLGWSALLLGTAGARRLRRRGAFWLVLVVAGCVLALGPYLHWTDAYDVHATTGIPLPYLALRNLPFMAIARVPRRFVVLADLGLDVLAGAGAAYVVARAARWGHRPRRLPPRRASQAVLAGLVLVPLVELATLPLPSEPVVLSPFFAQATAAPGDFALLELPITTHYLRDHARMINQTVHGRPIIGGYVARRVHDYYLDADSPFYQFIALATSRPPDILPPLAPFAVLNYYHLPYVVVYKEDESYEQPSDKAAVLAYVRHLFPDPAAVVADDAQLTAYRVPAQPAVAPQFWAGNGWLPPDHAGGRTWRWSSGQGTLDVLTPTPLTWHLRFSAATLRGSGHLAVAVNGRPLARVTLVASPQPYDAGTFTLPAGPSRITFSSDIPPLSPVAARLSTRDQRPLSFLISDVQLP